MLHAALQAIDTVPPVFLVFVVEDEMGIRDALASTLRRAGYEVETYRDVGSVGNALDAGRRPFLILLDVTLEGSDAVEVLQELSKHQFGGAIQLLSGNTASIMDDISLVGKRRNLLMLPGLRKPCRMQKVKEIADAERSRQSVALIDIPAKKARVVAKVSLADALDAKRAEVWYQPKFDLRTGTLVGAECLSRVRQDDGSLAMPGSFLPGADAIAMERLTEFVLRRALSDWPEFERAGAALKLSVNVSCKILSTFPLAAILRENAAQTGRAPRLILEITEEDALNDLQQAHEAATQLMIYGVELSIDDFGLGYSSISRLREVPFREIKLDRSLVQNCATDRKAGALCKGVVDLAHSLNAVVVGEGIEDEADRTYLAGIGCDLGQGYLLGRPMPKEAFTGLMKSGT